MCKVENWYVCCNRRKQLSRLDLDGVCTVNRCSLNVRLSVHLLGGSLLLETFQYFYPLSHEIRFSIIG